MKKILLLGAVCLLLVSCYSQKVNLNADNKSGSIEINYEFDDDLFQILSMALANFDTDVEGSQVDPVVLIDEDLFKDSFKASDGVRLKSVDIVAGDTYKGKIVIEFDDFEKTAALLAGGTDTLKIVRSGKNVTVSQTLDFAKMDPEGIFNQFIEQQKKDDIQLYNKLMKDADFYFEINTKKPIVKAEGVKLSNRNKKAVYQFKLGDLLGSKPIKFLLSL